MVLFEWNPAYSVKVEKFDEQHKKLVDLINQLHDTVRYGKGYTIIGIVLQSLIAYTGTHFADEVEMLQENGYPGLARQEAEHESFVKQLVEFQQKYQDGTVMLPMTVLIFLRDWLVEHIQGEDKKYGPFLNAKGIY